MGAPAIYSGGLAGRRRSAGILRNGASTVVILMWIIIVVRPPILVESGRKGAGQICQLLVFRGLFGQKVNFWCKEFGLIIEYFLSRGLTNAMQNLLCILQNFFLKLAGKPRWYLATVVLTSIIWPVAPFYSPEVNGTNGKAMLGSSYEKHLKVSLVTRVVHEIYYSLWLSLNIFYERFRIL